MKKEYVAPDVALIVFESEQNIMLNGEGGDSGVDPFEGFSARSPYSPYANGTVVNNNGAPTFVPGGNGGGGRQTPLG